MITYAKDKINPYLSALETIAHEMYFEWRTTKISIAENTDLSNARLLYTDLRGASLTHAVLSGAKLSRVKADKHAFDSSVFDSEDWSHWDIYYPDTVGKHGNHQSVTHDSILNDLIEVDDDTHVSLSELELYKEICIEHECPYSDYQ